MTGMGTMTGVKTDAPWHLWLVGVIAVLFNAIGAFDFVMAMSHGASTATHRSRAAVDYQTAAATASRSVWS
jgi:hypothetical protein